MCGQSLTVSVIYNAGLITRTQAAPEECALQPCEEQRPGTETLPDTWDSTSVETSIAVPTAVYSLRLTENNNYTHFSEFNIHINTSTSTFDSNTRGG